MVQLTKLSKKDFSAILSNYNIGNYLVHKHLDFALGNTNYIVRTDKGKYILKLFERSILKDVKSMIIIEEFLGKNSVKVPIIIPTIKENKFTFHKKKPVVIYEFLQGIHSKKLTKKLTTDMGKKIGLLHLNLLKLKIKCREKWPMADKLISQKDCINSSNFVKREFIKLSKELKIINYRKLKKSIVHGDLFYWNYLVHKDKINGFIDWDDAHRDYLIFI